MRGVTFKRDGVDGTGVIAQEIQKILPQVVHDKQEYLSVAYGNMVGVLIEAVKDLQGQIDKLKGNKMAVPSSGAISIQDLVDEFGVQLPIL